MSGKDRTEKIRNASTKELFEWLKVRSKATKKESSRKKQYALSRIKSELRRRGELPISTKH